MASTLALAASSLAGCSQPARRSGVTPHSTSAAPLRTLTPPFMGASATVALVRNDSTTRDAQRWWWGAQQQAAAVNLHLVLPHADDPGQQVRSLLEVLARHPRAILLDQGQQTSNPLLDPALRTAVTAGIPVAAYNLYVDDVPQVSVVLADDDALARAVLARMAADIPGGALTALLAFPAGYRDLDRRTAAWRDVAGARFWKQVDFGGKVIESLDTEAASAATNAWILAAALNAHPDLTALFAVNARLATDAVSALRAIGRESSVKAYAVVDHDFDPGVLAAAGSPWIAAALADPAELAAASVRTVALRLAGQLPGSNRVVQVGGPVIDQDLLRGQGVTTLEQVYSLLPAQQAAAPVSAATAPWLPNAVTP